MSYIIGVIRRALAASGRLTVVLRAGLLAGVVLAAVLFPVAAISGLGLKHSTELLRDLPQDLATVQPAQTTYLYANDGTTPLTAFYAEHRRYVPITEMSAYIQQAIVASEDQRFYQHNGVDAKGIARAFIANSQSGEVEQGASTLTMQLVRMALRDSATTPAEVRAATEQTTARKLREARLAVELEKRLSKAEILERYLNHAYFGHQAYGIYAAAEIFYSKLPAELDLNESATLAGLVQAPSTYDPASRDQRAAVARRNWVIDRMVALGYVAPTVAEEVKAEPIELDLSTPANDCVSVPESHNHWGFFCEMFRQWWIRQPAFGDNPLEREENLRRGGYRVVTSLDPDIQEAAQGHVLAKESIGSPIAHGVVAVEPGTGLIRAAAVNRVFSLDQDSNGPRTGGGVGRSSYPNTVNPLLGGGDMAGYQAGSTFKWFTLLAALEQGMPLSTKINSPHRYVSSYLGSGPGTCGGRWCPQNASGEMAGTHTMWSGFGMSVNTFFVQLQERVGTEAAVRMAERLGLTWRTPIDQEMASPARVKGWGAFTLGVADTTPLEMAAAYAIGGADGVYCEPLPVVSILDPNGNEVTYVNEAGERVPVAQPRCEQVVDPEVARAATDAALCPTGSGAARGACGPWSTASEVSAIVGRPVAGKTGTTDGNRTAWFVGFTPQLAVAGFSADPDNPFNAVGGGRASQSIQSVAQTLRDALKDEPVKKFPPPSKLVD